MKKNTKRTIAAAGGAAALAAIGAGAYYLYGSKDAKKHRAKVSGWMKTAEKEILNQAGKLKDTAFTEVNYKKIVGTVSKKYQKLKKLDPKDVQKFAAAVGGAWKEMERAANAKKPAAAPRRKKTAGR